MNRFTDIKTTSAAIYPLDSKEIFKIPWIFMTTHYNFKLRRTEAENLGRYLVSGGFLFAEPMRPIRGCAGDVGLRNMIVDALATQGYIYRKDWNFEKLPNDHLIYHCYYDFDGPPAGTDNTHSRRGIDAPYDYLEGVTIDGRLVAIVSVKDLEGAWDWWPERNNIDNTRQLQFLVNLIVFALTQEGSITHQVMSSLK